MADDLRATEGDQGNTGNVGAGDCGQEYVDGAELARLLAVSRKWVSKHTFQIPGRVKLSGRCVRYHLPQINKRLACGRLLLD